MKFDERLSNLFCYCCCFCFFLPSKRRVLQFGRELGGYLLVFRDFQISSNKATNIPSKWIHVQSLKNIWTNQKKNSKRHRSTSFYCFVVDFEPIQNIPANIYLFKVNNRNSRKRCKICSKFKIKTPEQLHWRRFSVFIANFEHILHVFLVFLLLTLNK